MALILSIDPEVSPRIITVLALGTLGEPVTTISMQQLVNQVRDWEDEQWDMEYPHLLNAYGKQSLGGGVLVGVTVELLNTLLAFEARTGPAYTQCIVTGGNLVSLDENGVPLSSPILPTAFTQVVLTTSSSATLVEQDTIQYSAFNNCVTIDAEDGGTGTAFPMGTSASPVNNLDDALAIATERGFRTFYFIDDFTFPPGTFLDDYELVGEGMSDTTFTFQSGALTPNCCLHHATVTGVLAGVIEMIDCHVFDISGMPGLPPSDVRMQIRSSLIGGTLQVPSNYTGSLNLLDSWSDTPTGDPVILDVNGAACNLFAKNFAGLLCVKNTAADSLVVIDFSSGVLTIDASCTEGAIRIRGVGLYENHGGGALLLDTDGLVQGVSIEQTQTKVNNIHEADALDVGISRKETPTSRVVGSKRWTKTGDGVHDLTITRTQ